jgi:rhodanese-related sulfurtransferase
MNLRRTLLQALILVVMASAIAIVANGFASRTRRLVLPGFYPNALKVPPRQPEAPALPPAPVTTATVEPVTETVVTETVTTIDPAATTTTSGAVTPAAPQQTPKPAPAPQVDPLARFQPHPDKAAVEISGEDAALLHSRGVLFLDARRTAAFEESHIAGARPFSVWEADIDDKVSALFDERSDPAQQNQPIVIYCTGGACEDSHMLAQKLWGIQFNNVYVYKDGFPDWQKRGGAVRSGPNP